MRILILTLLLVSTCTDDYDGDGYAPTDGDCDDTSAHTYPGAVETCNGYDNDCDGYLDNGCTMMSCDPVCVSGAPCGDTCIDPSDVCHVGAGSACYEDGR